jgi:hypothetical protein
VSSPNYKPIDRRTRESILQSLESSDPHEIHDALESAAYWDEDWRWVQMQLLRFSQHDSDEICWAVALGFTFLAVFHGEIDEPLVMPVLAQMKQQRPRLTGVVEEAEADIEHFVHKRREGADIALARRLPPDWLP